MNAVSESPDERPAMIDVPRKLRQVYLSYITFMFIFLDMYGKRKKNSILSSSVSAYCFIHAAAGPKYLIQ